MMKSSFPFQRIRWAATVLPLLFFCLGLAFLPLAGIQGDEALFAAALYHVPQATVFDIHAFGREFPLMLLSYLGALKTWAFSAVLTRIRPSYLTVRLPALLIGTLTAGLFVWLLEKLHGHAAAWVGGILLATDTMFLLTTCYDWGPVALQHLLALAAIVFVVGFATSGKRSKLFWGFLCFGLAFWDKALFVWLFSGLLVATIAIFPGELKARWSVKNLGVAAAGLILGALPLIAYNLVSGFDTLRSNSALALTQFPSRLYALKVTWDGEILFDFLAHAPWAPGNFRDPRTALFRISAALHSLAGVRYHYFNALEPAFVLGLLLVPLLWKTQARKPMLFCLITMTVAWLQMAFTKDAGLGAHHVVLLWPFPHWLLAVAFVQAAG